MVVAPVRSVLQPQVKGLGDLEPVELAPGAAAPLEDVVRRLADAAYSRVDLVEKRGEFAVRGGIVDVFPPTEEHPLRVEFWGDDVEEIRTFSVADQRTLEQGRAAVGAAVPRAAAHRRGAPPRRRAGRARTRSWSSSPTRSPPASPSRAWSRSRPVLVDDMELLVDLMPDDTHVLVLDPERARSRAHDLVATSEEFLGASWAAAAGGGTAPIDLGAASYRALADVREHALDAGQALVDDEPVRPRRRRPTLAARDRWRVAASTSTSAGAVPSRTLPAQPAEAYRGDVDRAIGDIEQWVKAGLPRRRACTPATARRSAWSRRSASATSRPGWSTTLDAADALDEHVVTVTCGALDPRLRRRGEPAGAAHRRGPLRAAGLAPATCAGCRPGASARSTRSSSPPATTSCTSSTASAGSWR